MNEKGYKKLDEIVHKLDGMVKTAEGIAEGLGQAMIQTFELVPELILWENTRRKNL